MRVQNNIQSRKRIIATSSKSVEARYNAGNQRVVVKTSRMEGWLVGQLAKGFMLLTALVGGVFLIGKLLSPIFNRIIDFLYELKKGFEQA